MDAVENLPPTSLGLWGDGDEIAAISEVERHFGVRLDYSDASNWLTVGDVFSALQRALHHNQADAAATWPDFAQSIAMETGVDPDKIEPETRLLGHSHFSWRLSLLIAVIAGLVLALILRF